MTRLRDIVPEVTETMKIVKLLSGKKCRVCGSTIEMNKAFSLCDQCFGDCKIESNYHNDIMEVVFTVRPPKPADYIVTKITV